MVEERWVRIEHMTEAEKRAYVIADNQLAMNAGWDDEILAEELKALSAIEDLSFDIGVIGFEVAEMDALVEGLTWLCCTNPERDSSCESSVIAGGDERTEHTDVQDAELVRV